ncbi:MAG: 50S ribosomal protein L9 [Clostridia bacterium]|nr:50S ribosomal protein L9 [Clostridia bacterium]MBQ9993462.1 50S ribosomal protein L9 [Clostridia bacterium]
MKVILLQDVKGTGKKDDVVNVSDGYGRNFLLPRKLAVEANAAAMNDILNRERAKEHRISEEKKAAQALADKLSGITIKMFAKAGASGKLFGSITAKEVAEEISRHADCTIDKRKVSLAGDIKAFGTYECEVKLYTGISAKLYVMVGDGEQAN